MFKPASLSLLFSSMLVAGIQPAFAETKSTDADDLWSMCVDSRSVFKPAVNLPTLNDPDQLDISAETIQAIGNGISLFENDVLIEKQNFRLTTAKVEFDKNTSQLNIPDTLKIETDQLIINGESGTMNNDNQSSTFTNVQFIAPTSHIQGKAPEIIIPNKNTTLLSSVSFSSCEPGKEAWSFNASNLKLDHIDESGSARHVVLRLYDTPIFYLPYISFPLGERRRSGILTPEMKFSSSRNGNEFKLPYYWNIAPNQDATITPNYMQKRGLQLITNYRYLSAKSNGEVDLEILDKDKQTDEQRYLASLKHKTQFTPAFSFQVDSTGASDSHYLDDFGSSLELSSISHLQQSAFFDFRQSGWHSRLLTQYFQTTDDTIADSSTPYRRKPQLTLNGTQAISDSGIVFNLNSELVNFAHKSDSKETGYRFDLYPKISWPQQGSYWFFTPTVGQRFTQYQVEDAGTELPIEDRNLSIVQLDSGLFFDRKLSGKYTHTLEPRLYYLNVPGHDQSDIPIFDSTEPDFSFSQLFRDNRFFGSDRVGDANQLTTALTTRIINDSNGNERFTASIGQIHYFDDREVQLNGSIAETDRQSDIATEMTLRSENWWYRLSLLQSQEDNDISKGSFLYHYQSDKRHIFNLGYRYREDNNDIIDQSDISFKWPVTDNWSVLARWNYSLEQEKDLENIFGFEYNDCCWAFRIIGRGHLTQDENNEDVFDRSIIFSLVLKGFGSTGKANEELERAILGFQPEY